jgi:ferric iron reductase protein FhuF
MTEAVDVVGRLTATVDYLRIATGDDRERDWVSCSPLVTDPDALLDLVRATAAGRGTDRDDVATSLFVQGYAFRVASIAIGSWVVAGEVIDVDPRSMDIAIGRHRPNAVRLRAPSLVAADQPLRALHETLVEGHLAGLVATAHASCRVGEALLWANVAAACASSFGAFVEPLADRRLELREGIESFFAAARPELGRGGSVVPVGDRWAWERNACCLWYQTDGGSRCEDCSLWSPVERSARYASMAEASG